jgi:hypothetical protein
MWVAIELATLTTVLMVGIYRTHEALEAAWKYFILGSVGIALALFGTILIYMTARPVVGEGLDGMVWSTLIAQAGAFDPALLNVAFVPVTQNMRHALARTYDATPDPKWVVAVGDCAVDGGIFAGSYAVVGGVSTVVPVDYHVRGCPPQPLELLRGLLVILQRQS